MKEKFMSLGSGGTVKKVIALGTCALVLQACAVPVPLKIASWALDGISYLATQKTITDHGLSMVAQKDCAMMRGLKGQEICREDEPGVEGVAVAALENAPASAKAEAALASASAAPAVEPAAKTEAWTAPADPDMQRVAAFDTAAGTPDVAPAATPIRKSAAKQAVAPAKKPLATTEPWGELYYVVASFREIDRADVVLKRYPHLDLRVLSGVLDGSEVYRVAAGPFHSGDGLAVKKMIRDAGLRNTWAVRMPSSRWSVARAPSSERQVAAVPGIDTVTID